MSLLNLPKVPEEPKTTVMTSDATITTASQVTETEQCPCTVEAFSLQGDLSQPAPDAWKETIGMFDGDMIFKEISEAGKAIRHLQRES